MNEIHYITTNPIESGNEFSTSHILASEVYDQSIPRASGIQLAAGDQGDAKNIEHSAIPKEQVTSMQSDEVQPEKYYRLGHTEDESFLHVKQTWRHVLNGNGTRLELLEFGIEAAGAVALLRFGVKKFWPMKALSKAPAVSAADDTILSQVLTGEQAKNHPVMKAFIRTHEMPQFKTR